MSSALKLCLAREQFANPLPVVGSAGEQAIDCESRGGASNLRIVKDLIWHRQFVGSRVSTAPDEDRHAANPGVGGQLVREVGSDTPTRNREWLVMKTDAEAAARVIDVLESFCSSFEARDAEGVMQLFAPDADVTVVTSEESLLRGPDELSAFLHSYCHGPTTYSWAWDRRDVSMAGSVAWLLAEGTEIAATGDSKVEHAYRMTMVCEKRGDRWLLVQVHGSSPHQA
jgi:uncharacterized protein (TIGR02246 family)